MRRYLDDAQDPRPWLHVAARLLAAITEAVAEPEERYERLVWAASAEGRFRLGDTTLVLSELPTLAQVEACRSAVEAEERCVLLTQDNRIVGSAQLLDAAGLTQVEVDSVSRFAARLIDVVADFDPERRDELIAEINEHF